MSGFNILLNSVPFNQSASSEKEPIDLGSFSSITGESLKSNLEVFPLTYISSSNNNFSFFCLYNAPSGEVNIVFPDNPCPALPPFDGSSGEYSFVIEIQTADLYEFFDGTSANLDLSVFKLFGNINSYAGELGSFSLQTSSILEQVAYSGEYSHTSLTIPVRVELSSDSFSGQTLIPDIQISLLFDPLFSEGQYSYINNDILTIVPNTTFTHFYGIAGHSQTNRCLTLNGAGVVGINAYCSLPRQLVNNANVRFNFKRTRASWWWDDDFTDSGLWFCFFPNKNPSSITFSTDTWQYSAPNYASGNFPGAMIIRMRWSPNLPIYINWMGPSGEVSNYLTVISDWTSSELNGTDSCAIVIKGTASNTTFTVYGKDDAIRQSGTFSNITNPFAEVSSEVPGTFLIHYHSYAGTNETFCDMSIGTTEGFVIVPFVYLGTSENISGELSLIDNLSTSVLFDFTNITDESASFDFTIFPSIDLGSIVFNSEKVLDFNLQISIIFDITSIAGETSDCDLTIHASSGLGTLSLNSDETFIFALSTFSLIRLEGRSGEVGIADLEINLFDSLSTLSYSGETNLIDFYTLSAFNTASYSGESGSVVLDIHLPIPLVPLAFSGESAGPISLVTSYILSPSSYSGESGSTSITTFPGIELSIISYAGGRGDLSLGTVDLLSGQAYSDQYADADLAVFYSSVLVPIAHSDQYATVSLRTIDSFVLSGYSDQNIDLTLKISSAIPLSLDARSGSSGSFDLLLGITFPSVSLEGARLFFDLELIINLGMLLPSYSGEHAIVADMATTYCLPLYGMSGEEGITNLSVGYAVQISGRSGEVGIADLTLNLPDLLSPVAYSGQYSSPFVLSTRTNLPNLGYSGEVTLLSLTDKPGAPLLFLGYSGSSGIASLQTAISLPVGYHYSGEWANVIGMTNVPNWYFIDGSECKGTLSTSVAVPIQILEGQICSASLDIHPSGPIGNFIYRSGEWMSPGLEVLYSKHLRVLYRTSIMTQVDIRSATYFDLTTDECCGERTQTNNLNFIIEKGQYPEEVGYGNRVYMEIDLRTLSRMKVEFPTGHTLDFIDRTSYLNLTFGHESHSFELNWEADLRHRLCKGYFIPTGNWIVVELQDILPEDCYADRFYGGETFTCDLSDDLVLRVSNFATDEYFYASLTTLPPWDIRAWSGETLRFDFPWEVKHEYRSGELLSVRFYEPPILIYEGATLDFELETEYGVRFLEEGCLDNEFVYQNEEGDEIPELFEPVPVEGSPYKHDIRAECF